MATCPPIELRPVLLQRVSQLCRAARDAPLVRLPVQPSDTNGLQKPSQLMADKLFTVPTAAIGTLAGHLEATALAELNLALRSWLQLA